MARTPKDKSEQNKPTILQSIRLANGDVYGPGEEDEFVEALKKQAKGSKDEPDEHTADDEIKRLSKLGHLVNFVDLEDDDEVDDITNDQKSGRAVVLARKEAAKTAGPRRTGVGAGDTDAPDDRERARNKDRQTESADREGASAPKRKGGKKAAAGDEAAGDVVEE